MNHQVLLSTAYFGPIQYFSKFIKYQDVLIEQFENYPKQSYRNRCIIMGANGPLTLPVPVERGTLHKTLIKDLRIAHFQPWQKVHFKSIESAYRTSPFYEYYIDDFKGIFCRNFNFLIDLNFESTLVSLKVLGLENTMKYTTTYQFNTDIHDFRSIIHPKDRMHKPDPDFNTKPYIQVFQNKFGFSPNLSILDLIFNLGPEAIKNLRMTAGV